jgi:eukaryotic-like serine/threonine-protein kinase
VREALITARLQHPGIVPVHDAGRWPTGEPYYVMKMVSGKSLKQIIRERKTLAERLALLPNVIAVAETIAYAHSEGVIHRDIKPANVMVGDFGETVVVDWGLASDRGRPGGDQASAAPERALDDATSDAFEAIVDAALGATLLAEDSDDAGKYSVAGKIIGTPAYMAPEQARGDQVDERSDIYALGALLYEVLAGERPFTGTDPHQILESVLSGPPRPLDERVPGVPPDLVAIVRKAMARDPGQRYAGARHVCEDLKRFQTGQLVAAHHYSTLTLTRRWIWRHRSPVAVACAGLTIMAVMATLGVNQIVEQRNQARTERAQAEVAQRSAEERRNQLLLLQAESSLFYDPTRTLAWLKQAPIDETSFARARAMADEAVAAGVAMHVLKHGGSVFDVKFVLHGSRVASLSRDGSITLWNVNTGAMRALGTLPDPVLGMLAASPDGTLLAATGSKGSVQAWDLERDRAYSLPDLPMAARDLRFSTEGSELILVMRDTVRLWHLESGRVRDVSRESLFGDPGDPGGPMVVSPDGRVAALARGKQLVMHGVDTGVETARITAPAEIAQMAFHTDVQRVFVRTKQSSMYVVELGSGRMHELGRQPTPVHSWSVSPDGRWLVTTSWGEELVHAWDLEEHTGRVLRGHEDGVYQGAFSADGSLLVTAGDDGTARVWDLRTDQVQVLRGHSDDVYRVDMTADGTMVATAGVDGAVRLWKLPASRALRSASTFVESLFGLMFTPSGHLVSYQRRLGAWLWDLSTNTSRHISDGLPPLAQWPQGWDGLAVSADGVHLAALTSAAPVLVHVPTGTRHTLGEHEPGVEFRSLSFGSGVLATADSLGRVLLWDLGTREPAMFLQREGLSWAQMSPDGSLLAVESESVVQVWSVAERRLVAQMDISSMDYQLWKTLRWMMISPDNQWMALQTHDLALQLWHLPTGRARTLDTGDIHVKSVVFAPDSSELAAATLDRIIRVWRVVGGEPELFTSHTDLVYQLRYSPDGSLLASASHDQTVRLWDRKSGRSRVLRGHQRGVRSLAFSPDGSVLASVSLDGVIRLWSMGCDPIENPDDLRAFLGANTSAVIDGDDGLGTPLAP